MTEKQATSKMNLIGQTIAGLVCHNYYFLNEVVVICDGENKAKAVNLNSISEKAELYSINQEQVLEVQVANNGQMFLFHTKSKQYLVNGKNQIVEDSEEWTDAFFDTLSNSFYRMNKAGVWYDLEGFKLQEKVFLKGAVLTSLDSKKSKKSLSFKNQDIYISPNKQLIQVGKLVFDLDLNVLKLFGEKITGLGQANVKFENKKVVQEVKLGLEDSAFIYEHTHEPYLFGDNIITKHVGSYLCGNKRIELFETKDDSFGVDGRTGDILMYNDQALQIRSQAYVNFSNTDLIQVNDGNKSFYFDLNKNEPFSLFALDQISITQISKDYIRLDNSKLFNVSSSNEEFVIYEDDGKIFFLDDGTKPQKVEDAGQLKQHFGFAMIDGQRKLFSKKLSKVLQFGKDNIEVAELNYEDSSKLISCLWVLKDYNR